MSTPINILLEKFINNEWKQNKSLQVLNYFLVRSLMILIKNIVK